MPKGIDHSQDGNKPERDVEEGEAPASKKNKGSQSEGEVVRNEADAKRYLKIVMQGNRLTGIFGINVAFDPGVMWELILRRIDLGPVREAFIAEPQKTARGIMSRTWR